MPLRQEMKAGRLGALALVVALVSSLLALMPRPVSATASEVPLLAWGNNDHAQLGLCLTPNDDKNDPRCLDPAFSTTPLEVSGLGDVTQMSAGPGHNLARMADGTVWAWGRNVENQLGDGEGVYTLASGRRSTTEDDPSDKYPDPNLDRPQPGPVVQRTEELKVPEPNPPISLSPKYNYTVTPLTGVKAIAAGGYHSLAVKDDGTVWAWGENFCGQLGNGKTWGSIGDVGRPSTNELSPPAAEQVPTLSNIKAVAAGRGHSLALSEDGVLWAWGENRWGQLGNGASKAHVPRANTSCAMPEDGPEGYAQIVPTRVQLPAPVIAFAAGSDHTLALTEDPSSKVRTVWSWGNNCSGQLGPGPAADITAFRRVPTPVTDVPADEVVALAAGGPAMGGHSLALTDTGEVLAWGLADVLGGGSDPSAVVSPCMNDPVFMNPNTGEGQAPDVVERVGQEGRLTPAPVVDADGAALSDVVALDAGVFHTLALQGDEELFAWGRNDVGQLGSTVAIGETAPAAIKAIHRAVTTISAGSHSLAQAGDSDPGTTTTTTQATTTTTQPTTTTSTTAPTTTTTAPSTTTTTAPSEPPPPPSRDRVVFWQRWENTVQSATPDARQSSAMAYDAARQRTILFGGTDAPHGFTTHGDTWAWNGVDWARLIVPGPAARSGHAMAYDAARQQVVLFGGLGAGHQPAPLGDTWVWNGSKWTKMTTSGGPSPRAFPSVAYDPDRSQVLLFGGEDATGKALGDTWAWDGTNWTELHPATSPPARGRSAMAYDPTTETALLYGGWDGVRALDDTWTWDGNDWRREHTGPYPERRQGHAMAYHPATRQIVLAGGSRDVSSYTPCCPLTWTWDGDDWGTAMVEPPPVFPNPAVTRGELIGERVAPSMAQDALGHLTLFGGVIQPVSSTFVTNDTRLFVVPAPATTPTPPPPPEVCANREPPPPGSASTTTTTTTAPPSSTTTTTQPSGTTVHGSAWKQESPQTSPSAREGAALAYDPVRKETVLFGGFNRNGSPCVHGDTWAWDGSNWTLKDPADSPPARYGHTLAYDAERGQVVAFGGSDGASDLDDTWTWDGTTWQRRDPVTAPSPRARHSMAYDAERQRVVLFGGDHQGGVLGDTWVWDGSAWTELHPDTSPPPRGYAGMAYDPARANTVLAGGWDGTTRGDTWLWDGDSWQEAKGIGGGMNSGAMAFDPSRQEVVLRWGANTFSNVSGDPREGPCRRCTTTRTWDGTTWAAADSGSTSQPKSAVPPPRMFAAMAEDPNGGVVFFGGYGHAAGQGGDPLGSLRPETGGVPYVDPANADQDDTWTYRNAGSATVPVDPDPPSAPAKYGLELSIDPSEIDADGKSTATATATVSNDGIPDTNRTVHFATDGDVSFSPVTNNGDGTYTTTITASRTAGIETITVRRDDVGNRRSAQLVERGIRVTLEPSSLQPDGKSTSRATATLVTAGPLADQDVQFATDGDVRFSAVERQAERVWAVTITASDTAGPEMITATASPSGLSGSAVLTESWTGWFDRSPPASEPAPPPRDQSAMAFDAAGNRTVLFGGFAGDRDHPFGDTWVWDGTAWVEQHPAHSPPARYGHAMAYDAARDQVVLFGGYGRSGYLGDTWTWDGVTWTEHSGPSPSARYRTAMAYDEARAQVVLFGGWTSESCEAHTGSCPALDDTWTWDGSGWTQRLVSPPPPPPPTSMARDWANDTPIVMPLPPPAPGCPGVKCEPDTATDDSTPPQPLYPSPIEVSGMTDQVSEVTVTLEDLSWTQSGPADADIMLVAPDGTAVMVMSDACGGGDNPHPIPRDNPITLSFDDAAPSRLPRGDCTSGSFRPTDIETPESTPFHNADAFPAPAPRSAHSASLDDLAGIDPNGTWSLYVVDDSPNDPNPAGEAGRIAGGWKLRITTTDAPVSPATAPVAPPGRGWAAMAYHGPSGKVVLYGGTQAYLRCTSRTGVRGTCGRPFNPLADTWTWDGQRWAQEGSGTHPGLRHSASMASHPGSGQLVLFGGSDGRAGDLPDRELANSNGRRSDTSLADTWTWDGTAWAPQTSPATPPSRHSSALAPGPSGTLVLFSGLHVEEPAWNRDAHHSYQGDTWVYERRVTLRLEPGVVPADGTSTAKAVATVVDPAGEGIAGLAVSFTTDGDATFSATTDHGDGTYSATVTASRTDGIETLTATTRFGASATSLNEVRATPCSSPTTEDPGGWDSVAPMPAKRWRMAVASGQDGRIYTFGGTPGYVMNESGVDVRDGDEYLPTVASYDPCTNTWQSLPDMPGGGRTWATATVAPDGRIYVIGGWSYTARQVEVYTPGLGATPGRWETLPPMPSERSFSAAAVGDDGRLYVMGSQTADGPPPCGAIRTADVYTPGSGGGPGRWERGPDLLVPKQALAGATAPDGRILAIGGTDANCAGFNTVEALAPGGDSWEPAAPMSSPRVYPAAAASENQVYVTGGAEAASIYAWGVNPATNTAEVYSACTQAWAPIAPMARTRAFHGAATGGDGRVYVLGGMTENEGHRGPTSNVFLSPTATVEAYTPDPLTDPCPKVSVDDLQLRESRTGTVPARFSIRLDRPVAEPVIIDYATQDGTATAGSDYVATSDRVVFAPGDTADKIVEVTVNGDAVAEGDETFSLELSTPPESSPVSFAKSQGTATILDAGGPEDNAPPQLSIGHQSVTEPFEGSVAATFTVSLDRPAPGPVRVGYATSDGSATAGLDYTATTGQVSFARGERIATVTVPVLGDRVPEPSEDFTVSLGEPQGAGIAAGRGVGTILNATPGLSVGDVRVHEGDHGTTPAMFNVTLDQASAEVVTVDYATADGSAQTETDYVAALGTLRFEPGEVSKTITVDVVTDTVVEDTETFTLGLAGPSEGIVVAKAQGIGTILDDDPGPAPPPSSPAVAPPAPLVLVPPFVVPLAPAAPSPPVVQPFSQPQPVAQSQVQPQAQQQAQQQTQQQAQQQGQQQAQQQGQGQGAAQGAAQAAMMAERQRETQVERAHISGKDQQPQTHLASARRSPVPLAAPVAGWVAAIAAAGIALVRRPGSGAAPAQAPLGQRRGAVPQSHRRSRRHRRPSR